MKRFFTLFLVVASIIGINAQESNTSSENEYKNVAQKLLSSDSKLTIGGYGEIHYNQVLNKQTRDNAVLDAHRMVLFFGYNFSKKTQFVTEIEMEYANEIWVEQMFMQHKLNDYINLKAGMLLIPMGIINEYHEPTTFNGVERPVIDNKIAPSTWREVGVGLSGNILPVSIKYQLYLVNGPSGYDGTKGLFKGTDGLRGGRQKASKSYMSSPNFTGKIEYFGIKGLNVGLSGYFGNSQSKLYDKLDETNTTLALKADSSVVGISMLGADARYNSKGLELRGQFYYTAFANTEQYNMFTRTGTKRNDLGSSMKGFYVEAGYNVLRFFEQSKMELVPFVRYQDYNLHNSVDAKLAVNNAYIANIITTGLTLKLTKGAVVKADMDFAKTNAATARTITLNAGIGVTF
jgi:hypothetical protein